MIGRWSKGTALAHDEVLAPGEAPLEVHDEATLVPSCESRCDEVATRKPGALLGADADEAAAAAGAAVEGATSMQASTSS